MAFSPLTRLRKAVPGSLTLEEVARRMKRAGAPRTLAAVSRFERGKVLTPPDEFLRAYAAAIGVPMGAVAREFSQTARWVARQKRPARAENALEKDCLTRGHENGSIRAGRQRDGGRREGRTCGVGRSASVGS